MVDWEARNSWAGKKHKVAKKVTLFKSEFDLLATMKCRRECETHNDGCRLHCGRFNEDFNHVLWCPHTTVERRTAWNDITTPLRGPNTCPFVISTLNQGVESWLDGRSVKLVGAIASRRFGHSGSGYSWGIPPKSTGNFCGKAIPCVPQRGKIFQIAALSQLGWPYSVLEMWTFVLRKWHFRYQCLYDSTEEEQKEWIITK